MKILYTISFVAVAGLLIYAGITWLGGNDTDPALVFNGPEEALVGVPFDLEVGVSNQSDQVLQDSKISLALPRGMVFIGQSVEENLSSKGLGNLGIGSLSSESFKLMITDGEVGDIKDIKVYIDYSLELLGSRFKKEEQWRVKVAGPAVKLTVLAPDKITSGATVQLKVNYENISDQEIGNLFLEISYPEAFQYEKSSLPPDRDDNYWQLGGLHSGSKNDLLITGRLIGLENSAHSFKASLGLEWEDKAYILDEQIINTAIKIAPVSLKISANNVSEYVATPGELINYSIDYQYLGSPGAGATVTAKLAGEMFEESKTLTWRLDNLQQSGTVKFSARVRDDYPIRRLGDRNFVLRVEARLDDGKNVAVAESENKVSGRIDLAAKGFFRDAASGILNKGGFPPVIGQATEYTIHWTLINFSNDARDIKVRAKLPNYVKFTGTVKSSGDSKPIYNKNTNEVVWEINRIAATRGIIGAPLEAIFQISATPPVDAVVGQYLPLIGEATINAIDEFTGFPLSSTSPAISTHLPDDKTIGDGEGRVYN